MNLPSWRKVAPGEPRRRKELRAILRMNLKIKEISPANLEPEVVGQIPMRDIA